MGELLNPSISGLIPEPVTVSIEQAQKVVAKHLNSGLSVTLLQELRGTALSSLTPTKSFSIHLSDNTAYILKVSPPTPDVFQPYAPNTLSSEHALLQLISSNPEIPHSEIHAYDTTQTDLPHPYLLLSLPRGTPLSTVKKSGKLTERQALLLDLKVGSLYKKAHETFQKDWFGLPSQEKEGMYSWQEAFTGLLESLLEELEPAPPGDGERERVGIRERGQERGREGSFSLSLPAVQEIRKYLSRAIGFFLFDDCEVPSLVSFLADDDSILVDFDPPPSPEGEGDEKEKEINVTSLLEVSHALWGDPLLEKVFMEPSKAFVEGYGKSPIVFPRQKTKRVWYDLFLALVVLVQVRRRMGEKDSEIDEQWRQKEKWAEELVAKSVEALKDAPCY